MKRYLTWGIILLIVSLLGVAIVQMQQTLRTKDALAEQLKRLPSLSAVRYTNPTSSVMLNDKPTVIILFDPDCEHCQYEATQIRQQQAAFAHTSVYWLTTQPLNKARAFAQQYGLDTLSMMHVGALTREEAYQAFGPTGVPHIFIYGADKRLRKEYKGEVKVEAILKYL